MNMLAKRMAILAVLALLMMAFAGDGTILAKANKSVKQQQDKSLQKPTARPARAGKVHNVGTLWNTVSNFGRYGEPDQATPSMEWPGGSGAHYLWEGRFWVGGIVDGEMLVSHADYGNHEWYPKEGSTFYLGPGKSIQDHYVIFDDLEKIAGHIPMGIEVRERGLSWSMGDYDDFIVYEYEIENVGDKVIEDFYIAEVYDCDVCPVADPSDPHIDDLVDFEGWDGDETDNDILDLVDPMDLDGDGETGYDEWGWPYALPMSKSGVPTNPNYDPSKVEPDGFWDEWQVLLDPDGPEIHWQTDTNPAGAPAGSPAVVNGETLHGYLIPRGASYMFDGDNPQTPEVDIGERDGTQPIPGFIFGRLIYSDIVNEEEVFPYRTTEADTFMRPYAHQWWNWESDPGDDIEKYQYMTATHDASTQFGRHYYFLPLPFDVQAPVFDYRFLLSTGPFKKMEPGEVIRFVFAAGVGKGFQGMRENMDNAMKAYYKGSVRSNPYKPSAMNPNDPDGDIHWVLPIPPPIPNLTYTPLNEGARLAWDDLAETAIDAMIGAPDFEGYKIYRSLYNTGNWEMVAAFDNIVGPVLVKNTEGEVINAKKNLDSGEVIAYGEPGYAELENFEYIKEDLPPVVHTYDDYGGVFLGRKIPRPINGLLYYYAVVAYDPYKPAHGQTPEMLSQESAKSNYMKNPESGAPLPVIPTMLYTEQVVSDLQLSKIKVVPNPYRGTALFESRYEDKIRFTNLPPACKISIFTLTGDLVDTIYHNDGTDAELWNLISRNTQKAVSGLYLYVVETEQPSYEKFIGKFVIIR